MCVGTFSAHRARASDLWLPLGGCDASPMKLIMASSTAKPRDIRLPALNAISCAHLLSSNKIWDCFWRSHSIIVRCARPPLPPSPLPSLGCWRSVKLALKIEGDSLCPVFFSSPEDLFMQMARSPVNCLFFIHTSLGGDSSVSRLGTQARPGQYTDAKWIFPLFL